MTNEQKGRRYQQLMFDYDLLSNKINSIKGESFELSDLQNKQIKELQMRQQVIMNEVNRLLQ
jgi:archaellum component FlaC